MDVFSLLIADGTWLKLLNSQSASASDKLARCTFSQGSSVLRSATIALNCEGDRPISAPTAHCVFLRNRIAVTKLASKLHLPDEAVDPFTSASNLCGKSSSFRLSARTFEFGSGWHHNLKEPLGGITQGFSNPGPVLGCEFHAPSQTTGYPGLAFAEQCCELKLVTTLANSPRQIGKLQNAPSRRKLQRRTVERITKGRPREIQVSGNVSEEIRKEKWRVIEKLIGLQEVFLSFPHSLGNRLEYIPPDLACFPEGSESPISGAYFTGKLGLPDAFGFQMSFHSTSGHRAFNCGS